MTGEVTVLGVGCRYRARWARDLRTWDLRASGGDVVVLEAPNGAGKTTFLRALVGLQPARWQVREVDGPVRYVPAGAGPPPTLRVDDHLALGRARWGIPADDLDRAIDRWGIWHLGGRFGDALSAGERRCVALALALAASPSPAAIVLDEPTAALDDARRALLDDELDAAAQRGSVVVLADHDPALRRRFGRTGRPASP